jgi:hypothetical protein
MRLSFLGIGVLSLTTLAVASVTVSSPTSGSTTSTSVHIASSSSSSSVITKTIVYMDNKQIYSIASGSVSTTITVATGSHNVVVSSWDSSGTLLKSPSISFTAAASGIPSNATKYLSIDQMTGWQSCDACAGKGGSGPSAVYSITQNLSSPALDGKAAKLYLQPSQPYSNALWWKQLGANSGVSNFQFDMYFYLKNPSAAQSLEFDMNQSFGGHKFIFGTQCDIKGAHVWDVYDGYNHKWMQTGIACSAPTAYVWNHLVLEFQRVNGQMKFVAVTLNGKKSYFNKTYKPASSGANELNVAVQLDGNGQSTAYSQWIDKVNMYAW